MVMRPVEFASRTLIVLLHLVAANLPYDQPFIHHLGGNDLRLAQQVLR